jgi:sugar phosphate permease
MAMTQSRARRVLYMLALVIAGEAIFGLPFAIARVFRPTLLDVFGITNLQLGAAFSAYGVVAMIAYFPGGPLADRFAPRGLMCVALAATAAVYGLRGIYFAIYDEAGVPPALTGTATGVVSVIGYTPDVFMGPLMGYLTDGWPGATGHRLFFASLAAFAALGFVCTWIFARLQVRTEA